MVVVALDMAGDGVEVSEGDEVAVATAVVAEHGVVAGSEVSVEDMFAGIGRDCKVVRREKGDTTKVETDAPKYVCVGRG